MKICGRKGQGHCLTFDPGITISLQFQKPVSQLQPYFICSLQKRKYVYTVRSHDQYGHHAHIW